MKPLESALLSALQSRLRADAAEVLSEQIACIDRVWWSQDTLTSTFYYVPRMPGQRSSTFRRFPADHEHMTLATARIEHTGITQVWSVDFEIAAGFIGALKFDLDPTPILHCTDPAIREFTMKLDPMSTRRKRPPGCEKPCPDVSDLHGWARECADRFGATGLQWPLEEELFHEKCGGSSCSLPEDYLDVMTQTDGITLGQMITISALGDACEVEMDNGTYRLLAEFAPYDASCYLGVKIGGSSPTVYRLGMTESSPIPLGVSFRNVVYECLRRKDS